MGARAAGADFFRRVTCVTAAPGPHGSAAPNAIVAVARSVKHVCFESPGRAAGCWPGVGLLWIQNEESGRCPRRGLQLTSICKFCLKNLHVAFGPSSLGLDILSRVGLVHRLAMQS